MSEGLFAKYSHLNAGAIPTSIEDLTQKHQKLLNDYSRLKAQHTVLKKAVKQEQANNAALQGTARQKDKELRKLQEQLDLLAFHNDRLTKRIEAVQESEHKGSHFSLLGGAVKKELERSNQALDAASLDLAKKIEENEQLHEELSEINYIYTNHVNGLHAQIVDLEKRVEEYKAEISLSQKERRDQTSALKQEKAALEAQVEQLKKELADKGRLLAENESFLKESDMHLQSEVESLRAILLAKAGDLENRDDNPSTVPTLPEVLPVSNALQILEEHARDYIYALREQTTLKGLPHEIAEKLRLSSLTWSEEVQKLTRQIEEIHLRTEELLKEKEEDSTVASSKDKIIAELGRMMEDLRKQVSRQEEWEKIKQLEEDNAQLEERIRQQKSELDAMESELKSAIDARQELEKQIDELRASRSQSATTNRDNKTTLDIDQKVSQHDEDDEDEDDEVFVYTGQDAIVANNVENGNQTNQSVPDQPNSPAENGSVLPVKSETQERQEASNGPPAENGNESEKSKAHVNEVKALKMHYENQIRQLTEMLQMADSKAIRYAKLMNMLKERLATESEEKEKLVSENERLQKEYSKLEELMATTESNYQNQLDMMTEYITQLQSHNPNGR